MVLLVCLACVALIAGVSGYLVIGRNRYGGKRAGRPAGTWRLAKRA